MGGCCSIDGEQAFLWVSVVTLTMNRYVNG